MMDSLQINSDRLWARIAELAQIGAIPDTYGCSRLALTDEDKEGRDLVVTWMRDLGMEVSIDGVGNVVGTWFGDHTDHALPPVMTGSHIDTVRTGGRFDGNLGVLAGLEIVEVLIENSFSPLHPISVGFFTGEEGARFAPDMLGSLVYVGGMSVETAHDINGIDGKRFGDELERIGFLGNAPCPGPVPKAFLELHIEQGPILETEERTIGVVTAVQGQRWYEITVTGQESHAGPTPMPIRRDALVAASKIVQEINRIGHHHPPHACATVDFRHPADETLSIMDQTLKAFCAKLADESQVRIDVVDFWYFPPTPFEDGCVEAVREGAKVAGFEHMDIVSGAGHDAVYIAGVAPTGMIFVPCENGISHNEIENATPEDCAAGCQVLLHAILARAETLD